MKIVIYAMGTLGDVLPLVGIGQWFDRRNYQVLVITNETFVYLFSDSNLKVAAVTSVELYQDTYMDPETWTISGLRDHYKRFHFPAVEPTFNLIKELHEAGERLAVICQPGINGAAMACERFGLPCAQVVLSPSSLHSTLSPSFPLRHQVPAERYNEIVPQIADKSVDVSMETLIEPLINPLRKKLGLKEWSKFNIPQEKDAECLVALFPDWFRPIPDDWPTQLHFAGFPRYEVVDVQSRNLVDVFTTRYGRPLVFTLGTSVSPTAEVINKAKILCEIFSLPGIFVSKNIPDTQPFVEETFLCVDYVDFLYLFSRASLVVHHGGIGTSAQAIAAGVPQLICPMTFDQPDNAYWLYEHGVANAIDFDDFAINEATAMIDYLLTSEKVSRATRDLQKLMGVKDGAEDAGHYIEEFFSSFPSANTRATLIMES